jgi:thiamine-phosphate pyrophosphorylase
LIQQARPKIHIPICAIGGIGSDNLRGVLAAGADFVAVISAVSQAADPKEAAALLVSISAA